MNFVRPVFDRIVLPRFKFDDREVYTEPENEEDAALDALAHLGKPRCDIGSMGDIRQILTDNAIRDMLEEEDRSFFSSVRAATGQ